MILRAEAPAKINRELRVGGRREDGFHEIRSRFSTIDLADNLEVEVADRLELSCSGIPVPADDSNLVARAARALAEKLGIPPRARVHLEKKVPTGAGLGGGSADAAIALRLLSALWNSRLTEEELSRVAAGLGSDVPFFLFGGEADVTGRGETVSPREDAPQQELLLVVPPFSIATAEVYAAYSKRTKGAARLPQRLEIEETRRFLGPNDLASAVLEMNSQMVNYLRSAGEHATEFGITGSGSALLLCGVSAEGEERLAEVHPEATLYRSRTMGRTEYGSRTSPQAGGPAWKSPR